LFPQTPRTLQYYEVWGLAALYWPGREVKHAVDVAFLESGFQTHARNTNGEDSRGLWQINVDPAAHPDLAQYNLFDAQVNAYFAYRIWLSSGWAAWYNSATSLGLDLGRP
jgi:hypothetical protein